MSIDVFYTLARMVPAAMKPYKKDIIDVLNDLRFDKMKPVRDATLEAIQAMRDVPDSGVEQIKVKTDM